MPWRTIKDEQRRKYEPCLISNETGLKIFGSGELFATASESDAFIHKVILPNSQEQTDREDHLDAARELFGVVDRGAEGAVQRLVEAHAARERLMKGGSHGVEE